MGGVTPRRTNQVLRSLRCRSSLEDNTDNCAVLEPTLGAPAPLHAPDAKPVRSSDPDVTRAGQHAGTPEASGQRRMTSGSRAIPNWNARRVRRALRKLRDGGLTGGSGSPTETAPPAESPS